MKNNIFISIIISLFPINIYAQNFDQFFSKGSLRVDYIHTANSEKEIFSLDAYYHEPHWGGSKTNLIDTFNYGHYKFEVYDSTNNTLLYSRGYSTLCREWCDTEEATKTWRSFSESIIMPFPKETVHIVFYSRNRDQSWKVLWTIHVNPNHYSVIPQLKTPIEGVKIHDSGDATNKLDIVLLAEGYNQNEIKKFMKDADRFKEYLLNCSPFDKHVKDINIWAIPIASKESGTDIPGKGIYKNTFFDSHFYTFGTERYINTINNKTVRDVAANVPYDQIYILVNTEKYGGAGIYNYYSICTADHKYSDFVFTHEFGHAFAGLADEYYTSDVAIEDFYSLDSEPWEPNITTLINFDKKWKPMIEENTPVPTPYTEEYLNSLGVFEGAGYMSKGVYRPKQDCSMKSVHYNNFCPVCTKAIVDMIKFYTQ